MNKHIKLIAILIILLFLINACVTSNLNPFTKKEKEQVGRGLKLSFQSAPDKDIKVGQRFPVLVLVENFRNEPINAKIEIFDQIEGSDVYFIGENVELAAAEYIERSKKLVPGKTVFPSEREDGIFSYKDENIFPGTQANIHAELTIESYDFSENLQLCVRREDAENAPCLNKEVITSFGGRYGAFTYSPVTIKKIDKTITELGENDFHVDLDITLSNEGGGEIFGTEERVKNTIDDFKVLFGSRGGDLTCLPNPIVFSENVAEVNCVGRTTLEEGPGYQQKNVKIGFSFPYKMTIKKGPIPVIKR